jgi:NADH-quinone oxidoreductase subunit J
VTVLFWVAAAVAVAATVMVVTRADAVHALLYLVVSLLALALDFWLLGAPFVAALEVIVYAGAILVLFVFVVMLMDGGRAAQERERLILNQGAWLGPGLLALVLLVEITWIAAQGLPAELAGLWIGPKAVAVALYGPYVLGVEVASFLLLAGLVGAWHLGRQDRREPR